VESGDIVQFKFGTKTSPHVLLRIESNFVEPRVLRTLLECGAAENRNFYVSRCSLEMTTCVICAGGRYKITLTRRHSAPAHIRTYICSAHRAYITDGIGARARAHGGALASLPFFLYSTCHRVYPLWRQAEIMHECFNKLYFLARSPDLVCEKEKTKEKFFCSERE
jgi:hypothetical protein